ncbi:MAG: hypothetical protein WCT99_09365, partial [Bacteroidota bacterium]
MKKIIVVVALTMAVTFGIAQKSVLFKTSHEEQSVLYQWKHFDGNRINAAINSAGPYADFLEKNINGLEWPIGSKKTAVYTAGIWIVGKHRPTDSLRTAVQYYQSEFQPGPILGIFNTTTNISSVAANPNDQKYHIYKIDKFSELFYTPDYAEWPGDLGAPFNDINNNGVWDKGIDTPKLYGDQTLWCVYNDLNLNEHPRIGATEPMGLEVQATYFGYSNVEYLKDIMFMKWRMINKSDADYDSVYLSMWSDIDLGDVNDDMAGCDTTLNLSYMYNGDNSDGGANGYDIHPPACGFVLLQGPLVQGDSNDTGYRDDRKISGVKNRPMTSHAVFFGGSNWNDPPMGNVSFAQNAFNYQRGVIGPSGQPFINPQTNSPNTFVFPGDPVTQEGWTQTVSGVTPQDTRSMLSSGPFTLAQGDTQEIIGAFVIAQGTDRLNSISKLRAATESARTTYNFHAPLFSSLQIDTIGSDLSTLTLRFSAQIPAISTDSVKIYVYASDRLGYNAQYYLTDDGAEGDLIAGDNIYSTVFSLPIALVPYSTDLLLYNQGTENRWTNISQLTTAKFHLAHPVIYSDNLNHDGNVNAGETVRFGLVLKNQTPFRFDGIVLSSSVNSGSSVLNVAFVSAATSVSTQYNAKDPTSYCSFTLPLSYASDYYTVFFTITDTLGNRWNDSIRFPVTKIQTGTPLIQKIGGRSNATFDIVITDQSKIQNHTYVLYGIDSTGHPSKNMFGVKDSSTGTIIASGIPASPAANQWPTLPANDGFTVLVNSVTTGISTSETYSEPGQKWVTASAAIDTVGLSSTIYYGRVPDIEIRFSQKLGYTDLNANGKYDLGEPYSTDSLNTNRSQRAYFYRQESGLPSSMHFNGYRPVPFALFDVSTQPARQLTVVIDDKNKNNQWDAVASNTSLLLTDVLYVVNTSYDSAGLQYDSSKGGTDLSLALRSNTPFPLYYKLILSSSAGIEPYHSPGTLTIMNSHPFCSLDRYVFNPTKLTMVKAERNVPLSFNLSQNFPNPFNPATTIRYSLPKQALASITIYNILGQKVRTVVNEVKNAGTYEAEWNGRSDGGISV